MQPLRRACHAAGVVGSRVFLVGGRYWDVKEDDYIFLNDIQASVTIGVTNRRDHRRDHRRNHRRYPAQPPRPA